MKNFESYLPNRCYSCPNNSLNIMNTLQALNLPLITISLTQKDHEIARKIATPQLTKEKQKQVYLNVLSVLTVKHYLDILGIQSDFASSETSTSLNHLAEDIANLKVTDPKLGKQGLLECRYCQEDEINFHIPFEALEDRIAYVFIQFDVFYQQGNILGFLPVVNQKKVSKNQLKSLTELIEFLYEPAINWIYLRDWLNHQFSQASLSLEEVMKTPKVSPKFAFRVAPNIGLTKLVDKLGVKINLTSPINDLVKIIQTTHDEEIRWEAIEALRQIDPNHPAIGVRRIYQLQDHLEIPVALMVSLVAINHEQVAILLKVYPIGIENSLPPQLSLSFFEGTDILLEQIVSNSEPLDMTIQLKFLANFGEKFTITLSFNQASYTKHFIV